MVEKGRLQEFEGVLHHTHKRKGEIHAVRESLSHFYTIPTQGLVPALVGGHSHLSQRNQGNPSLAFSERSLTWVMTHSCVQTPMACVILEPGKLSINSLITLLKVRALTNIFLLTLFPGLFQKPFPVS